MRSFLCAVALGLAGVLPTPWQEDPFREDFEAITRGVGERPIPVVLTEGSCGILELGWNEHAFPILASDAGVFVAASKLGRGRVVAFGGQDFFGADEESTFVGIAGNDALVRNAARWASVLEDDREPRVLADNPAAASLFEGWSEVRVASILERRDPHELRDWSAAALAEVDVAVVLVNEWDSTHVRDDDIASLRAFVERGGGLLIGGSSYHWEGDDPARFPANRIVDGAGIRWNGDEEPDLASARVSFGPFASSASLWDAYLEGESLEAWDMARLTSVFASVDGLGRDHEIERALKRLLAETPELPVASSDPRARLAADVAFLLEPRAWPAAHPWAATFPGLPAPDAERIDRVVEVDASWTGARPLGLYAPPGEVVTLSFVTDPSDRGLWVAVGDSHDDLRTIDDLDEWERAPRVQRGLEVREGFVRVSNPFGGPIYLGIPEPSRDVKVRVQGAIAMAVYTLGETNAGDWKLDLGAGAPQAILQARGHVRFVVPTSEAAKVEDPDAILEFWSGFHASHAELAQEPAPRRFESHWIFDPQVGSGYANATPVAATGHVEHWVDRLNLPTDMLAMALTTDSGEDDYWTIGHELGHQFQTNDWIGGDLTEVGVNLFPLYTKNFYVHDGGEHETKSFEEDYYTHADLVDFRWDDVGDWEKLQLYRQLVLEFGWDAMKRTFASYYSPDFPREEYGGHTDGFAIRFSAIVGRDLTRFLEHWEYPLSAEAAAKIRSFELEPWMPPGW